MSVHAFERRPKQRVRRWAAAALRDLAYDAAVAVWGLICLGVLVAGVSVTASTLVFVVGAVVWVAFVYVMRATTAVDRRLAAWQRGFAVPAAYRRPPGRGFVSLLKAVTTDRQTWRDAAWLTVTSVIGPVLGLVGVVSVAVAGEFISIPIRYWAAGPVPGYGPLHTLAVDTASKALLAGAVGVALLPLTILVARACAAGHSGLAGRVLAPPAATVPVISRSPNPALIG